MSAKSKAGQSERRARAEQLKAEREAAARASERRSRLLVILAVLAAVAVIAVAVVVTQSNTGENAPVPQAVEPPDGGAPFGEDGAPVVLNEWVDFSCPACKTFNDALADTMEQQVQAGELQVFYHPLTLPQFGAPSVRAANAFGCAVDQGLVHEYYDGLFGLQGVGDDPFSNESLIALGEELGLDNDQFADCVNGGDFEGWISNVNASQFDAGVFGTPTIFLNGEVVELPAFEPDALLDAIEQAKAASSP